MSQSVFIEKNTIDSQNNTGLTYPEGLTDPEGLTYSKGLTYPEGQQHLNNQHTKQKDDKSYEQKTTLNALSSLLTLLKNQTPSHSLNKHPQYSSQSTQNNNNKSQNLTIKNIKTNKSQFSKQSNIDNHQQPYIITSSHKSFSFSSKSITNKGADNSIKKDSIVGVQTQKQTQQVRGKSDDNDDNNKSKVKTNKLLTINKKQSQKRIRFDFPQPKYQKQPQSGISLYEQVLAKNFQVIDSLLKKLNLIYTHQQGYDRTITELSQKMHKLQVDNENIHHEFRTSHFMIDKKLNSINNQFANMLTDINFLKKIWNDSQQQGMIPKSGYLRRGQSNGNDEEDYQFQNKVKRNSLRKRSLNKSSTRVIQNSHKFSDPYEQGNQKNTTGFKHSSFNNRQYHSSVHNNSSNHRRSGHKKSLRKSRKLVNLEGLKQQNLGRVLLEQINESNSWQGQSSSKESNQQYYTEGQQQRNIRQTNNHQEQTNRSTQQNELRQQGSSQPELKNQWNKNRKKHLQNQKHHRKYTSSADYSQLNTLKRYISQQILKQSKKNQQLNKFTQLGIQTIINKKYQLIKQNIQQQLNKFKKQLIQEKIQKQFRKSLLDQIKSNIQKDIQTTNSKIQQNLLSLQKTLKQEINTKCDKQQLRQDLKQILQSINKKVHALMEDCYHNFADRGQTKRAILFLQKKINKLVQAAQKFSFDPKIDDQQKVKCLSCNKSYGLNTVDNNTRGNQTQSQPMLGQVHLLSQSQQNFNTSEIEKDNLLAKSKRKLSPQNKHAVRFRQLSRYNSVSEIFQNERNKNQEKNFNNKNTQNLTKYNNSKDASVKKLKNSQTSQSLYLPSSSTANSKSKYFTNCTQQNKLNNSNSLSTNNINQRDWKQKASTMLKKQTPLINWRSKSQYKKT